MNDIPQLITIENQTRIFASKSSKNIVLKFVFEKKVVLINGMQEIENEILEKFINDFLNFPHREEEFNLKIPTSENFC